MRYYIGTTLENLELIIKGGAIVTRPPHRVWKDYSKDFIYLVPQDFATLKATSPFENKSIRHAFRQADFAVYELNHTRRVVLEISDLDDYYVTEDTDARDIEAVKYPFDISLGYIKKVYIDAVDCSKDVKAYVGLLKFAYDYMSNTTITYTENGEIDTKSIELFESVKGLNLEKVSDLMNGMKPEDFDLMGTIQVLLADLTKLVNVTSYTVEELNIMELV